VAEVSTSYMLKVSAWEKGECFRDYDKDIRELAVYQRTSIINAFHKDPHDRFSGCCLGELRAAAFRDPRARCSIGSRTPASAGSSENANRGFLSLNCRHPTPATNRSLSIARSHSIK
jgi:hypothetical protein